MRVAGSIFFIWMRAETKEGMNQITSTAASTAAILNLLKFWENFYGIKIICIFVALKLT